MPYEKKEGQISLFLNSPKKTDNSPDFSGTALVNGAEMRVALWKRMTKDGKPMLSGQITPSQEQHQSTGDVDKVWGGVLDKAPKEAVAPETLTDEVPF